MSVIAFIAGASRWPQVPELDTNRCLANSADQVAECLLSPDLQLRFPDLKFVFDDPQGADELDRLLGTWLRERQDNPPPGSPVTDVVFYYIGHGHRANDALYLTVQSTRGDNLEQSSWNTAAVAETLRKHAPKLRKHIVLDCCYGGAAIAAFQKPDDTGVAVFYAAEKFSTAVGTPTQKELTPFTEAFVTLLKGGVSGAGEGLSLAHLLEQMRKPLQALGTNPNVVDTVVRGTPVSRVPVFPNRIDAQPSSDQLMRRELYAHLSEIERQFEDRLQRRIAELQKEHEKSVNVSASKITLLTHNLEGKLLAVKGMTDASVKKVERRGWKRSVIMLGLCLGAVVALLASGVFRTIVRRDDEQVVVNPALGWQGSIRVKRDEQVCIMAEGRVHLGLNQVVNAMNAAKSIIAKFAAPGTKTAQIAQAEDDGVDLAKVRFHRPWTGPEGVDTEDSLLGDARLRTDCSWGRLVAVVIAKPDAQRSSRDPFAILRDNNLFPDNTICVGTHYDLSAPRDGELVFIVNDAVVSTVFPERRPRSKEILDAMTSAAPKLAELSAQRAVLDVPSLPLFWYADNGGQYVVRVRRGACPAEH